MKLISVFLATALAATLTACGGGGGDALPASVGSAASLATYVGTYKTGCITQFVNSATGNVDSFISTIVISADGNVSIKQEEYISPVNTTAHCASTFLDVDATVIGTVLMLGTTKNITSATSTKTGIAQLAQFTYTGLNFSKGTLTATLPAFGTKGNAGFLLEGNQVYVLRGSRKADGFPDGFSTTVLTKQ
jgi:hypothetical protein